MGFKKFLKKAGRAVGRVAREGASLALKQVPGASVAEKLINLKNQNSDRKRAILEARVGNAANVKTAIARSAKEAPKLKPVKVRPPKPGLLSVDTGAKSRLASQAQALIDKPTSSLAKDIKDRNAVQGARRMKTSIEKRAKGLTQDDWQDLAKRYKASGSSKSWEEWLDTVL